MMYCLLCVRKINLCCQRARADDTSNILLYYIIYYYQCTIIIIKYNVVHVHSSWQHKFRQLQYSIRSHLIHIDIII